VPDGVLTEEEAAKATHMNWVDLENAEVGSRRVSTARFGNNVTNADGLLPPVGSTIGGIGLFEGQYGPVIHVKPLSFPESPTRVFCVGALAVPVETG
jgi:hypothetical protein